MCVNIGDLSKVSDHVQVLGELVQNAEQRELLRAMLARDKER